MFVPFWFLLPIVLFAGVGVIYVAIAAWKMIPWHVKFFVWLFLHPRIYWAFRRTAKNIEHSIKRDGLPAGIEVRESSRDEMGSLAMPWLYLRNFYATELDVRIGEKRAAAKATLLTGGFDVVLPEGLAFITLEAPERNPSDVRITIIDMIK